MKKILLSFAVLALVGAGCASAPPQQNVGQTPKQVTILVSTGNPLTYCNGADMDSDGYRKTITQEKTITIPSSPDELGDIKAVAAATSEQIQDRGFVNGITFTNGVVHIPAIDAWAGISIAMCAAKPQVEVNLLRLPGVTRVVWE